MRTTPWIFSLVIGLVVLPVRSAETVLTPDDVLAMMARVPASEHVPHAKPAPWHKIRDAHVIAKAIARAARTPEEGSRMVVYDVWESGNDSHARGDFDKTGHAQALGAWQLHNVPAEIADNPYKAVFAWRDLADMNAKMCADHPEAERLAGLASGSCDRALDKVRHRDEVSHQIITPLDESAEAALP